MVKFTFAAILAASIAAPALGAAIRIESRDVDPSSEDLVGRAVAEIMSNVFTREELSEVMGRDIEEFNARDLSELMSREYDVDESLITRDFADVFEARSPFLGYHHIKKWFGKKPHPQQAEGGEPMSTRDVDEDTLDARDFDEDMFEARAEAAAPAPKQPNIIEKFLNLFRNKNHPGAKEVAAKKGAEAPAPAAPEPAAPAAPAGDAPAARDFLDIPEERSYYDEEMFERDFENVFEERAVDDDMMERDFEEDVYEREYEEMSARDYFVEEFVERYFDEMYKREYEDVLEREYAFDELD